VIRVGDNIDQTEINNVAWRACDTFRGVIDPSEYKNYILVFLFLKYISDLWKDRVAEYEEKYGRDEKRIRYMMRFENFILPEDCSYDYIYKHRNDNDIGEKINIALARIEEANKAKLEGVFRNIDFNSETALGQTKDRNRRLKNLIEDFSNPKLDLRPSRIGNIDVIGNTYEYLISHFASDAGKKGGEFYTPAEVSILISKLVDPEEGDRICDPTVGSGSLLIKVAREVGSEDFALYGQELNGSTWALCKMNMFLHGVNNAQIEWGDTINNPKLLEGDTLMKFNIVVANPPFSLDKWGAEDAKDDRFRRFHRGVPPKSKGDYAFITHMIETMNENDGRVGVVVPHGVLFRGSSEGKIRKKLIEENLLDSVIGLPSQLFFGTGIPAAILVYKKGRDTTDVLFIDASREFQKGKKQNKLRDEDIDKIHNTYKDYKTIDKYSYRATFDEIRENDFNLNIPRYVDTFEEEEEIDISATQRKIEKLEGELSEVREKMTGYLKELGLYE
jgi:type I restriction enzyme M protein